MGAPPSDSGLRATTFSSRQKSEESRFRSSSTPAAPPCFSPGAQKILNCRIVGSANVVGVGDAGQDAPLVRVPAARVGGAVYSNGTFIVLPLPFASDNPWPDLPFGGMIGREFFRQLVTVVDYQKSILTFHEAAAFSADPKATMLPLRMRDDNPNIEAAIDGHPGRFDIDTGAALGLYLTKHFVEATGLRPSLKGSTTAVLGHGLGGVTTGTKARAKMFTLGNLSIPDPIVGIPATDTGALADAALAGNIGTDILRRFTLTLDVPHAKMYLVPNAHFKDAFA